MQFCVAHFHAWRVACVYLAHKCAREHIALLCRSCQASCTFVATKVTCRTSSAGAVRPLFRLRRKFVPEYHDKLFTIMKEKRSKYIKIRMTREEMERIKEKSASYTSVSHFIRSAVAEHSGVGAKQKLELIRELGGFYREFRNGLSHIGGNLNQSVRRANELSTAGLLTSSYVTEVLMPAILETRNTLDGIKKALDAVTRKAVKL